MRPFFPKPLAHEAASGPGLVAAAVMWALLSAAPNPARAQDFSMIVTPPTITPAGAVPEVFRTQVDGDQNSAANTDRGRAIDTDELGNVYVAGSVVGPVNDRDFVVVSARALDGSERWSYRLDGGAGDVDEAVDLLVDGVFAIATGSVIPTGSTQPDLAVVKLDVATGTLLWPPFVLDNDASGDDRGEAIAIAPNGDIIVGGETTTVASGKDIIVCRIDTQTGAQVWCTTLDGTETTESNGDDFGGVAVDSNGDVFVAGSLENAGSGSDISIIKLNFLNGGEFFRIDLDGLECHPQVAVPCNQSVGKGGDDIASDIVVDDNRDAYVVGTSLNTNGGLDMTVVKIDGRNTLANPPTSRLIWREDLDIGVEPPPAAEESDGDEGIGIALDAQGQLLVTGTLLDDPDATNKRLFTVAKLASADAVGQRVLWMTLVDGTSFTPTNQMANDAIDDANGDVFAVGAIGNAGTREDHAIVKLDGSTGAEIYRVEYIGENPSAPDFAFAVTVDLFGNVVATGQIRQPNSPGRDNDMTIVRLPEPLSPILGWTALAALGFAAHRRRQA